MKKHIGYFLFIAVMVVNSSCVSKKMLLSVQYELDETVNKLRATEFKINQINKVINEKDQLITKLNGELSKSDGDIASKEKLMQELRDQIVDLKAQRSQQLIQVEDLTVLSKSASDNIGQTIKQLEAKDRYINMISLAKSKTDSLNLALAINLKSVLKKGIDDEDIEVKVDKTVVYVNLSDKMMYQSGSATITPRADEVLSKIATILKSRPELDVMVEGYTDNNPISTECVKDNWDLSVSRSTAVVRELQTKYGIDPNKLIAAGRGEYNVLADNNTSDGRAMNRRTRIILLPRLNQFYDLLNPSNAVVGK